MLLAVHEAFKVRRLDNSERIPAMRVIQLKLLDVLPMNWRPQFGLALTPAAGQKRRLMAGSKPANRFDLNA